MIHGVDGHAIGKGIYNSLSENDQAVIGFGMAPKWFMDVAMDKIKTRLAEILAEKWGYAGDTSAIKLLKDSIKKDVCTAIERELISGLFDGAKAAGKMVV